MTPAEFLIKWRDNPSSERAGAQAFFLDLCELLGVEKPNDPDRYCFERGATRTGAGRAFLLQGGDCAESFADFNERTVTDLSLIHIWMPSGRESGHGETRWLG